MSQVSLSFDIYFIIVKLWIGIFNADNKGTVAYKITAGIMISLLYLVIIEISIKFRYLVITDISIKFRSFSIQIGKIVPFFVLRK
jgi:hypothetical protein